MKRNLRYDLKLIRKQFMISCVLCGKRGILEQHRIDPTGTYEDYNVMCVCDSCHHELHRSLKYDRIRYDEMVRGRSWTMPIYEYEEEEEEEIKELPWGEDY